MVGAWVKSDAGPAGSHDILRLIAHHWQSSCRHRLEERGGWSVGCAALPEAPRGPHFPLFSLDRVPSRSCQGNALARCEM